MIYTFTKERIVNYHKLLITKFGGIHGYNNDILEAVIYQPYITLDRKDLYKTNIEKVCRLAYGLVARHPFLDGNKRIGILVLFMGIKLCGYNLVLSIEKRIKIGLGLADGSISYLDLVILVKNHIKKA